MNGLRMAPSGSTRRIPFLSVLKEQFTSRLRRLRCKIKSALLVPFGMLLSPENSQKLRPIILYVKSPRHLCVAGEAQRQHPRRIAVPRFPVMYRHRALPPLQSCAPRHPTTVVVSPQHLLTMTTKVFLVLALQRIARRAHPLCENLGVPTGAMHHDLLCLHHVGPAPIVFVL